MISAISRRLAVLAAVAGLAGATAANAQVTRLEILQRESISVERAPAGATGGAGLRERISGKVHGELDPNDPKNAIITDIKLARADADAMVAQAEASRVLR